MGKVKLLAISRSIYNENKILYVLNSLSIYSLATPLISKQADVSQETC